MIISHQHKYIFFKPRKTASTSVEAALAKHTGPNDIVTPNVRSSEIDDDAFDDYAKNDTGYFNHIRPSRVRRILGKKTFDEYYKFTIVRNPWDVVVSRYFWNKKNSTPRATPSQVLQELRHHPLSIDRWGKLFFAIERVFTKRDIAPDDSFETFLRKLPRNISNSKYYFDRNGKPWNQFVIRYEHLDEDYKTVCEKVGVPYEQLPALKTKVRSSRRYQDMYTPETRDLVAKKFKKEIDFFGYTFD